MDSNFPRVHPEDPPAAYPHASRLVDQRELAVEVEPAIETEPTPEGEPAPGAEPVVEVVADGAPDEEGDTAAP